MKKICIYLLALVMVALMVVPVVGTDLNETNITPTTGTVETTTEIPVTTAVVTETTTVAITTTTVIPTTTPQNATAATTAPVTTVPVTTAPPETTAVTSTTGSITAASSPMGAALLIDGVYHGITPVDLNGIPTGNHIVRLTLSGYHDYEGSIYVAPDKVANVFGTLIPSSTAAADNTPIVITVVPTATPVPTTTSSGGILESPTVLAAIIGIITASIGAIATIFPHLKKKE